MKQQASHEKLLELGNKLDIPMGEILGLARLEMSGNCLTVENHRGVIRCTDYEVSISGGSYIIAVFGRELSIHAMTRGEITLCGKIQKIEFVL